jgi:hypothetical protein
LPFPRTQCTLDVIVQQLVQPMLVILFAKLVLKSVFRSLNLDEFVLKFVRAIYSLCHFQLRLLNIVP